MTKNYDDFVRAMGKARADGHRVEELVITEDTMKRFLVDGEFNEETEEQHDDLGEFAVPIKSGDDDYVLTNRGERYPL